MGVLFLVIVVIVGGIVLYLSHTLVSFVISVIFKIDPIAAMEITTGLFWVIVVGSLLVGVGYLAFVVK